MVSTGSATYGITGEIIKKEWKHIKFCISRMNDYIITKFVSNEYWVRVDIMM